MIGLNQLIVETLQNLVKLRKEAQIDDEFMAMARDIDYITETLAIGRRVEEFALSDRKVAMSLFSKD